MGLTRAFVAIGLPGPARQALAQVAEAVPGGRAVDADNLHLTLAFLDALDDGALEEVHDVLEDCRSPGFSLRIEGLGLFGASRPRSLWAGVTSEPGLTHLQAKVAAAVRGAGIDLPHRNFVPHVTLARFGGDAETPALQRFIAAHAGLALDPVEVRAFGLYASHLGRRGAEYEALAAYPLIPPTAE